MTWLLFARNCIKERREAHWKQMWLGAAVDEGFDKTDREFGGTRLGPVLP